MQKQTKNSKNVKPQHKLFKKAKRTTKNFHSVSKKHSDQCIITISYANNNNFNIFQHLLQFT